MHGYETSEVNSHEVRVNFQSTVDILKTEMIGNQEYSIKVENEPN